MWACSSWSPGCCCLVAQSCRTLWDPMDCSPPGIPVHGILQARMLEWVAISFSRGSSSPRDRTGICCIGRRILNPRATWEAWSCGWVVIFFNATTREWGVRTNPATETIGNVLEAECFENLTYLWKKRQKHRDCFLARLPGSCVDSLADRSCAILAITIKRSATSWRQSWHCLANKARAETACLRIYWYWSPEVMFSVTYSGKQF